MSRKKGQQCAQHQAFIFGVGQDGPKEKNKESEGPRLQGPRQPAPGDESHLKRKQHTDQILGFPGFLTNFMAAKGVRSTMFS
mmetsp:Transcript_37254/g.79084  ORF Transcript_37254/g.79084 Transcript_37254/m.79084 type:complete len:82 (+) Transcript_37254:190-435(+)